MYEHRKYRLHNEFLAPPICRICYTMLVIYYCHLLLFSLQLFFHMIDPDFDDGDTEIYRIGATVCIDIHPTDFRQNQPLAQVELRCPISVEDRENNIPPRIPVPDLTWTHIDRMGNTASFNSDIFGTDDDEFSDTFPLLDPMANMNIFILNTNPNPPEGQDSLIFRIFNITKNESNPRYQILSQAFGTWICRVNNSLGDENATTIFSDMCK